MLKRTLNRLCRIFRGDEAMHAKPPGIPFEIRNRPLRTDYYVDNVAGSDSFTGTEDFPFATIEKAISTISRYGTTRGYGETVNIWVADSATPYDLPDYSVVLLASVRDRAPQVRIRGDHGFDPGVNNELATATLTDTSQSSGENGWILTATGAGWTEDEFRGKIVKITSGARSGKFACVYRNTSDTLYCSPPYKGGGNGYLEAPAAADTISIREYSGVTLNANADMNLGGLNFWGVKFRGTANVRVQTKVQFLYCDIQIGSLNAHIGGWLEMRGSYIANTGTSFAEGFGMVTSMPGSHVHMSDGLVIDGLRAAQTWAHCTFDYTAVLQVGDTTFRGLGQYGVVLIGSSAGIFGTFNGTHRSSWGFDDCDAGPDWNIDRNGNGGVHGGAAGLGLYNRGTGANGITGRPEIVKAVNAAYVKLDATSTLTGSGGAAIVSASDGATITGYGE